MDILNLIEIRDQRTNKENKPNNKLNKIQLQHFVLDSCIHKRLQLESYISS